MYARYNSVVNMFWDLNIFLPVGSFTIRIKYYQIALRKSYIRHWPKFPLYFYTSVLAPPRTFLFHYYFSWTIVSVGGPTFTKVIFSEEIPVVVQALRVFAVLLKSHEF